MGKVLIVAEKPAAGKDIAKVVGADTVGKGYMEGNNYIVTWAIGHLIELKLPSEHDERYKVWNLNNLPIQFPLSDSLKVKQDTASQFKVIKNLISRSDIDYLINAGDAGREGYLIQEWIYRMSNCKLPKKVLWASSLTTAGIKNAMSNLKDSSASEFKAILNEAEARAEGDYFLGMNYSPLLSLTRSCGMSLSYGRCQTPLLNMIVTRCKQISEFVPEPFWDVQLEYDMEPSFKGILINDNNKPNHFMNKQEVDSVLSTLKSIPNEGKVIQYNVEEKSDKAPLLYNLAKLQQQMGKQYKFSPDYTLEICQSLYEKHKMLSYPRTDSQYLSLDVYDEIKQHIDSCNFGEFSGYISQIDFKNIVADKSYFNDLKVTDHHALIPTINPDMEKEFGLLSEDEKKVFVAVVLSLIAIFFPRYIYESTNVVVGVGNYKFLSSGTTVKQLGYRSVLQNESSKNDEELLPRLTQGQSLNIKCINCLDKKTVPPKFYNDETIVKAMEKYNIGTSATRAEIIKSLQNRKYISRQDGKYKSTELGEQYINIVPEELKSVTLTQKFEHLLKQVNEGKMTKADFLNSLASDFCKHLDMFANSDFPEEKKLGYGSNTDRNAVLGKCLKCGSDVIIGKFGPYCSNKCGLNMGKFCGANLNNEQISRFLSKESVYVKGLKGKEGKTYNANVTCTGYEEYSYTKDNKYYSGYRFTGDIVPTK